MPTTVFFYAEKIGIAKTTPYYVSGQSVLNPEEKDPALRKLETWQIELRDGANELGDRLVQLLMGHVDIDWYVKSGVLSFVGQSIAPASLEEEKPKTSDKVTDISTLSIKAAEPVVKAETNIELLKRWETDPRTGIKDLVGDRLLELGEMPNV
jgi:hypothetical protein